MQTSNKVRKKCLYKGKNAPGNKFKMADINPLIKHFISVIAVNWSLHQNESYQKLWESVVNDRLKTANGQTQTLSKILSNFHHQKK